MKLIRSASIATDLALIRRVSERVSLPCSRWTPRRQASLHLRCWRQIKEVSSSICSPWWTSAASVNLIRAFWQTVHYRYFPEAVWRRCKIYVLCFVFIEGQRRPAQINPRGDGTFDVVYYPDVEGPCKVDVLYAGKPVVNRCEFNAV